MKIQSGYDVLACNFILSLCSEMNWKRRATESEEESKRANQARREVEAERHLAEKERQERVAECLSWREKYQELADMFQAQEDLKALRQNKAVRQHTALTPTEQLQNSGHYTAFVPSPTPYHQMVTVEII